MKDKYGHIETISTYNKSDEHFVVSFKFLNIDYPIRVIINTEYGNGYSILSNMINAISEIVNDPINNQRSTGAIDIKTTKDDTLPSGDLRIYAHSIFQNQIIFEYSINGKIQVMVSIDPEETKRIIDILADRLKYYCSRNSCGLI